MEENFNRTIVLEDSSLKTLVEERDALLEEAGVFVREMEEAAEKHKKANEALIKKARKIDDVKMRIIKKTEKAAKDLLGEFEIPITTILEDGKVLLKVNDAVEEFKARFKKHNKFEVPVEGLEAMPKKKKTK